MTELSKMDPMILIKKVLDKAAIDGALTESASKYFNSALEKNREMKQEIEILNGKVNARDEKIKDIEQSNTNLTTENKIWIQRESDLEEREELMLRLELVAQYEKERVDDHKEMFSLVFKNLGMRRTIFTAIPGTDGGQYQTPIPGHVERDDEITETE